MFGQSLLSAFGSAACTTDTDQLFPATTFQSVATYQLNGNVNDLTGNYNGTQSGGTWETNGEFLGCWNSDGVSDEYLQASQPPNVKTVSAWVYVTGTPSNSVGAIVWTNGASSAPSVSYLLGLSDAGKIYAFGSYVGLTRTVTLNQWYHVAATYNAGTVKIYWEGTHVETRTTPFPSVVNGTQITIGRSNYAGNVHNFNGSIDQIRIYDKTLTSADITTLYNETVATSSTNITFEGYNGIAYYKMSDATDQLGNYNGTATDVNFNTVGKFGFAGGFNGSSSEIVFPSVLSGITNVFSYSCWFKITDLTIPFNTLDDGSNQNTNVINYIPRHSNGNYYITFGAESNRLIGTSPSSYSDGGWHHMVVTKSSSSLKFYSDGVLLDEDTSHTDSVSGLSNAQIAHYSSTFSKGSIDQIRIYDSALSAANVTTLYEEIECPAVTSDTYLVVGGGAGSGSYGGGGAGGYLSNFNRNSIEFTTGTVYTITVGAGGATSSSGGSAGTNGDASVLSGSNITTITASGGGYGGNLVSNISANSGASGGGGASDGAGAGGAASPAGQGNAGGIGAAAHPNYSGGGGGGAGAVGNAGSGATGGNGGVGIETSITGTATYFAGGGGGTGYAYPNPGTSGTGGSGGGGTANPYGSTSTVSNATPNTGGGGGGNGAVYSNGSGGSGIVVLRYSSTKSITIASGSLSTGTLNTSIGSDKYTTFIGGTGTVTFS